MGSVITPKKVVLGALMAITLASLILTKPVVGGNAPGYLVSLVSTVSWIVLFFFWKKTPVNKGLNAHVTNKTATLLIAVAVLGEIIFWISPDGAKWTHWLGIIVFVLVAILSIWVLLRIGGWGKVKNAGGDFKSGKSQ